MKLDPNCIRKVLLFLEREQKMLSSGHIQRIVAREMAENEAFQEYSIEDVLYTAEKLMEAGFITASHKWNTQTDHLLVITGITYQGHQFLETVRDNKVWGQTKKIAAKVGSFSVKTLASVAEGIVTGLINQHLSHL